MFQLIVVAALSLFVIVTGAVLHFFMPDSPLPVTLIGLAVATLVPAVISMAKEMNKAQQAAADAHAQAHKERKRADQLFEETQALKKP